MGYLLKLTIFVKNVNEAKHFSADDSLIVDHEVKVVGWGQVYDEKWSPNGAIQDSTSCVTTNQGPVKSHFQPCSRKWVSIKCFVLNGWAQMLY